jgi:hypothetical protein
VTRRIGSGAPRLRDSPPATSMVEVRALIDPRMLVEVAAVAYRLETVPIRDSLARAGSGIGQAAG